MSRAQRAVKGSTKGSAEVDSVAERAPNSGPYSGAPALPLSVKQLEQAATLLAQFHELDDVHSHQLVQLVAQAGSLGALVDQGLAAELSLPSLQFFACYKLLLRFLAYESELVTVLVSAGFPGSAKALPQRLDEVSQLLPAGQTALALAKLSGVVDDLASAAASLPQEVGGLVALGLIDLVES